MKSIAHGYSKKQRGIENPLHIETPLGIINIYAGLKDTKGREIDVISITPSGDYSKVKLAGKSINRLIKLKQKDETRLRA